MSSTFVVWLFSVIARLPLGVLHRFGALMGWGTYWLSGKYSSRLRENLGFYNAGRHAPALNKVLRASVAEAGKSIAELPWVWRRPVAEVLAKVRHCYGREHFDDARKSGKGLIVLTPHLGCFEIIGLYVASEMPMTCMYSTPKRVWMDDVIRSGRQRGKMFLARADIGGVRTLFKALKRGEAIGLLPDQVPANGEGEWADFFGKPAYTMTLAGRLLESTGARVLLSYVVRRPHGDGYDIHFAPLELKTDIPVTRQINSVLEKIIRTSPAQYLWSYNRYKVPLGSMPFTQEDTQTLPVPVFQDGNRRSKKVHIFARLSVFILWLIHFLPFRVIVWIGELLGMLLHALVRERRRVATINLKLCFPDMPDKVRERLVRDHFKMFGRGLIERCILWWSSAERISSLIHVEGVEHFEAIKDKSSILLTPHFVGMDAGGQWIAQHTDTVCMYANQKNRYLTELLLKKRARFRNQRLYSRQQGLRPILKGMREGNPFIYPPDQDQGIKDGAFISFFGVPTATMTSVPRIAQRTGAKVVPSITRVLPGAAGYVLTFYPAWENYPSGDDIADTRRMNEFIEQRILEMPEQYFWLHKRFKTRPEGENSFYPGD
jgi:KDO2-lipid IV(A) lauroyltransferase